MHIIIVVYFYARNGYKYMKNKMTENRKFEVGYEILWTYSFSMCTHISKCSTFQTQRPTNSTSGLQHLTDWSCFPDICWKLQIVGNLFLFTFYRNDSESSFSSIFSWFHLHKWDRESPSCHESVRKSWCPGHCKHTVSYSLALFSLVSFFFLLEIIACITLYFLVALGTIKWTWTWEQDLLHFYHDFWQYS